MSTADRLMEARKERERQEEIIKENIEEYKKALNMVAGSQAGQYFLKTLIKACGVFTPTDGLDGVSLIEHNARRSLYLRFVRNYLEPQHKQELEV